MKKVECVYLKKIVDKYVDTSYLGEYTNKAEQGNCCRRNAKSGEYKYFHPANPETRWQDFRRMEALNNGEWCYMEVCAIANVAISADGCTWTTQHIEHSVSGIESDSSKEYFQEVAQEELQELKRTLIELGFGLEDSDALPPDIVSMFNNVEWRE